MPTAYHAAADVLAAPLARECILLHVPRKRYFRLNGTGAAVWEAVAAGATRDEIVDRLCARYPVAPATVADGTDALLARLLADGLVTRSGDDTA
ncbi:MAG: PqqD family protein [Gemmatirosa sp.]|nr:PqqD family protein [Gemmatirosa sp.]